MVRVASVRFKNAGRVYFFDPAGLELKAGDDVIVETARGIEFAQISADPFDIDESKVVAPLKPVLRLATQDDYRRHEENLRKKERALAQCQEKIERRGLEMKLVDVEFTLDSSKVIFYFTADGRVDFRDLVKDLASVFKMRIELRQIGVRDETKMMGGIGTCGRDLCCHAFLSDFEPVSIKMAKVQNLSLNPIKISGICGRLMCCLQYENDCYCEMKKGMPEISEIIDTPQGRAVVEDISLLEDRIKTRLMLDEKDSNSSDKLSPDYYFFSKEEIRRLGMKHQKFEQPAENKEAREKDSADDKNTKNQKRKIRKPKKAKSLEDANLMSITQEELEALSED